VARAESRILVTRSQPGASALASALEACGCPADVVPLVGTERIAGTDVLSAFESLPRIDVLIFTSVHAVVHFCGLLESSGRGWPATARVVAVGAATAGALRVRGVEADVPADERSEGILDLPIDAFDGGRILIVGGEGGRRALDSALEARGARVERIAVYRRVAGTGSAQSIDVRRYTAAVVSSVAGGEALVALARRGNASGADVRGLRLIVPSRRVADALRAMGFARVIVSAGAGPAAVVAALRSLDENTDDR